MGKWHSLSPQVFGPERSRERTRPARDFQSDRRLVARPPLDVATDARHLFGGGRSADQNGVEGGSQIGPVVELAVARTAGGHLAAVHEATILIDNEEIRRAGSL